MLNVALTKYPHTKELIEKSIPAKSFQLDFANLPQGIFPAFRKMARSLSYDASEFGISTALCAVDAGLPIKVLPVFLTRRFDHGGIYVRESSPYSDIVDLANARIAVRSITVTDVVWSAGIMMENLGGSLHNITWYVTGDEHLANQALPPSAKLVPDKSTRELLAEGVVDVVLDPNAGGTPGLRPLFPDVKSAERVWQQLKGYIPPHHTFIITDAAIKRYPNSPQELFTALVQAKASFLEKYHNGMDVLAEDESVTGPRHDYGVEHTADLTGPDPMPYGFEVNERALQDIVHYMQEMGLLRQGKTATDYFLPMS